MIRITCTKCKAQLSIDDAFAGGACRCQHCGTIQTVPKHLKNGAAPHVSKSAVGGSNVEGGGQYKTKADIGLSSGLDAIAEVVASSGLSRSGLSSKAPRRTQLVGEESEAAAPKSKMLPILLGAGGLIIVLLGIVIWLLVKGGGSGAGLGSTAEQPNNGSPPTIPLPAVTAIAPAAPITGINFFGLKVVEPSVVFVLDRGNATHATFDAMKTACMNVIDAMKPDQTFQVIFWKLDQENEPAIYPSALIRAGDKTEVKKLDQALEQITSFGQTDPSTALDKAFATNPTAIIIATGKPMDDIFVTAVMDARKSGTTKVHCVSLAEPSSGKAMREVAEKTGGTYKLASQAELQSVAR